MGELDDMMDLKKLHDHLRKVMFSALGIPPETLIGLNCSGDCKHCKYNSKIEPEQDRLDITRDDIANLVIELNTKSVEEFIK